MRLPIRALTTHIGSGITPRGGRSVYSTYGVPFIRSQNVQDGFLDLTGVARIHSELHSEMSRSAVRAGDVLINITGASLGRSCVVSEHVEAANVSQHVCILRPNQKVQPAYLQTVLAHSATQRRLRVLAAGGSREGLNYSALAALSIPYVEIEQQRLVVNLAGTLNVCLRLASEVIAAKARFKHALMQQLLSEHRNSDGRDIELARLGDHAQELVRRNDQGLGREYVMGVIKGIGLQPMRSHVRATNVQRYKVVPASGFAYNPMRLNIGSIAHNLGSSDCLVSPDYVVFCTNSRRLLPAYLDQFRKSRIWGRFVETAGSGSVRKRIYFRDLAEIQIPLPPLAEQKRIAAILGAIDVEIAILERLRRAYDDQKRALLDKLLASELPVSRA
jgi:type I restriction enzyme, S subunit